MGGGKGVIHRPAEVPPQIRPCLVSVEPSAELLQIILVAHVVRVHPSLYTQGQGLIGLAPEPVPGLVRPIIGAEVHLVGIAHVFLPFFVGEDVEKKRALGVFLGHIPGLDALHQPALGHVTFVEGRIHLVGDGPEEGQFHLCPAPAGVAHPRRQEAALAFGLGREQAHRNIEDRNVAHPKGPVLHDPVPLDRHIHLRGGYAPGRRFPVAGGEMAALHRVAVGAHFFDGVPGNVVVVLPHEQLGLGDLPRLIVEVQDGPLSGEGIPVHLDANIPGDLRDARLLVVGRVARVKDLAASGQHHVPLPHEDPFLLIVAQLVGRDLPLRVLVLQDLLLEHTGR